MTSPLIVIGMHRSGTSLVTDMLESLGLFTGVARDPNREAWFFLRLNDWLLEQSGGNWEHPAPISYLLEHQPLRALALEYIRTIMRTPHVVAFLGWQKYLRCRSLERLDIPWGWKDPRNTFTLPLWLELFPEAKVIHICRHGVDVARSLQQRQQEISNMDAARAAFDRRKPLCWLRLKRSGFIAQVRCSSLEGGFTLWEEYMREARRHVKTLGARAVEIRYEDFLNEPRAGLAALAQFCNLAAPPARMDAAIAHVRPARACAYQADPALRAFAAAHAAELAAFGYHA